MDDVQLAEDRRRVRGEDHLLQVVDDDLVAAVGAERGLHGLGDGPARFDVAEDGAIFGLVAVRCRALVWCTTGEVEVVTFGSLA